MTPLALALALVFGRAAPVEAQISFTPAPRFPVEDVSPSVAAGDLNGDGLPDAVRAGYDSGVLSVLLGVGMGRFMAGPALQLSDHPRQVVLGDLNGDARLDLVVSHGGTGSVSVLLGDGSGRFGASTDIVMGAGNDASFSVALGDLNGDGRLDLVAANSNLSNTTLAARLGTGTGDFAPASQFPIRPFAENVVLGDVNRDGFLDAVVGYAVGDMISILAGNGTGGFSPRTDIPAGPQPSNIALGDVDGDSRLDIIASNHDSNTLTVLLGVTATLWIPISNLVGLMPNALAAGDLNGDAHVDVVLQKNSGTVVLLGNGTGTFTEVASFQTGNVAVALADMNADGFADVLTTGYGYQGVQTLVQNFPIAALEIKALLQARDRVRAELAAAMTALDSCSAAVTACEAQPPLNAVRRLTVTRPSGGTIFGGGLRCGTGGDVCVTYLPFAFSLALAAIGDTGHRFAGWSPDCPGGLVTMTIARTCSATFVATSPPPARAPSFFRLTISPRGGGTVYGAGIRCGEAGSLCGIDFPAGIRIGLEAVPSAGFVFAGWTGSGCSAVVTMNAALVCSANFVPLSGARGNLSHTGDTGDRHAPAADRSASATAGEVK